jgi:hypothetical protein
MNTLELCMYARGLRVEAPAKLVVIGDIPAKDAPAFEAADVSILPEDDQLPEAMIARVRAIAHESPRRRKPRTTVSG